MDGNKHIIYNAMRTPDGTVLHSRDRHDYVTHIDANGEKYMVDGGTDYLRRSVNKPPATDLSVYSNDPHEKIRQFMFWGTLGKDPDYTANSLAYTWVALMNLSDGHINAIINTQNHLSDWRKQIFKDELDWRKRHHIFVEEVENYEGS